MEQQENLDKTVASPNIAAKAPSHLIKGFLKVILMVVLLTATCVGVFYWQQREVDNLNKINQSLSAQLSSVQTDKGETSQPNVIYRATVGKFSLTIPDKYAVIQRNDGGGEGGPSTSLVIGDKTSSPGIVNSSMHDTVTITAYGLTGGSFREYVDGELKDRSPQKQSAVQIDGTSAEVYLLEGFAAPKNIYFSKNNLFYKIELSDTTDAANQKLEVIIAGFKFN